MIQFNSDIIVLQGEDRNVLLYLFDEVTNQPIDLTNCQTIIADVFINNEKQYSYSLLSQAGYGVIEIDTNFKNVLHLKLEREQTKTFKPGAIKVVVLYQFNSIQFPFGFKHKEVSYQVGRIQSGVLKHLNT